MTIEKRGNSYRIKEMRDGKMHRITVDHKPTKAQAQAILEDYIRENCGGARGSFESYANKYIEAKENVLSPSTVRGYRQILRNLSDDFKALQLGNITTEDVQREINQIAVGRSSKTVANFHGFIVPVLSMFRPNFHCRIKLPQPVPVAKYIPTPEDVRKLIECAKGTEYEVALRLACYGLRRGEIVALQIDDLVGNEIHIHRALAMDSNNNYVEKTTKTYASNRVICIDDELAALIRQQGYIYRLSPNNIINRLHEYQKRCGLPAFRLHDLRHYFVTELSEANIPEEDVMYLGGYSSPNVMKKIYRHNRMEQDAERRKAASAVISSKLNQPGSAQ